MVQASAALSSLKRMFDAMAGNPRDHWTTGLSPCVHCRGIQQVLVPGRTGRGKFSRTLRRPPRHRGTYPKVLDVTGLIKLSGSMASSRDPRSPPAANCGRAIPPRPKLDRQHAGGANLREYVRVPDQRPADPAGRSQRRELELLRWETWRAGVAPDDVAAMATAITELCGEDRSSPTARVRPRRVPGRPKLRSPGRGTGRGSASYSYILRDSGDGPQ